jgi:SAM-dependent methyltransferase
MSRMMNGNFDELLARAQSEAKAIDVKRAISQCLAAGDTRNPKEAVNTAIHRNDQMFTHSLREHKDTGAALAQYFNIGLQQYHLLQQIVRAVFDDEPDAGKIRILDFACGYGRLVRFLPLLAPIGNIRASELQSEALDFVVSEFGVKGIPSLEDPSLFHAEEKFDLIWVASLFSHLPASLFSAWLEKLYSLLSPSGILCFSVRDVSLFSTPGSAGESGILYESVSENAELSPEIYGTTFASERYVRDVVRTVAGEHAACLRLPRALACEQDLYLVARDANRDLDTLNSISRGAWGWVDRRELSGVGDLYLEGWAGPLDGQDGVCVEISLDGEIFIVETGIPRADVGAALLDPRLDRSGWVFRHVLDAGPSVSIRIIARTADSSALLYIGDLSGPPVSTGAALAQV